MYRYNVEVTRVVDGDTVDVDIDLGFGMVYKKQRVRMMGIDTPESRTRNKDEKARGKLAAKFLSDAIEKADTVIIRTELRDSRGKFGRVLGTIVCDGVDINNAMVENYMAAKYFGQNKTAIEAVHQSNRTKLIELGLFKPVE